MGSNSGVCVYHGEELGRYGFGGGHPFGPQRLAVFWEGLQESGLLDRVEVCPPVMTSRDQIELFHSSSYVDLVERLSQTGRGYLDYGDTPAFPGMFEATSTVVGTVLDAVERLVSGRCSRAFVPIAGLHHAHRLRAGGFCVFNDCAVAIETLRARHGIRRVGYVDIDAHHGDGVMYGFEEDPDVIIGDIHEDGRYLFPGTGFAHETGSGEAIGTKLNIPMPPGAGDSQVLAAWPRIEEHIGNAEPEFILLQCGADCLAGDPITHMACTAAVHTHATARLCALADRHCDGKLLALGGGGYDHGNIVAAWLAVISQMLG